MLLVTSPRWFHRSVEWGIERLVEDVCDRAGLDKFECPNPSEVARKLGLSVVAVRGLRTLGRTYDGVIEVRASLPCEISEWVIGHEIGHTAGLSRERDCDYFGAALQMRRAAFSAAVKAIGLDWEQLAALFGATPASVALRAGELFSVPIAVVTPSGVYARGEAQWPDRDTLRMWARNGAPLIEISRIRKATIITAKEDP